jgi:hypothetical protein
VNRHLTEIELINYCLVGNSGLSSKKVRHLQECPLCLARLNEQIETDHILKQIQPQSLSRELYEPVIANLPEKSYRKQRDWFFYITIAALLIIAIFLSYYPGQFNEGTGNGAYKYLQKFIEVDWDNVPFSWKERVNKIQLDSHRNKLNEFTRHLGSNPLAKIVALILIVVLFYLTIDYHYLRNKLN